MAARPKQSERCSEQSSLLIAQLQRLEVKIIPLQRPDITLDPTVIIAVRTKYSCSRNLLLQKKRRELKVRLEKLLRNIEAIKVLIRERTELQDLTSLFEALTI